MSAPVRVLLTELRLFAREPGSLFRIVGFPAVLVGLIGLVSAFREPSDDLGGQRVVDIYVPIAILLAIIVGSVQAMPTVVATYREQGILRRISTTPARARDLLAAQYVIHGLAVACGGGAAAGVGWFAYGVGAPAHPAAFLAVAALALAACLALGGVIAGMTPHARGATAASMTVLFPLMFTAGLWFPVQTMPGLLGDLVPLTPLGAAALGLDAAALGEWPDLRHFLVILAWAVLLGAAAVRWFRWE